MKQTQRSVVRRQSRYRAVVPAAGIGLRMSARCPKQYLMLAGKPVLRHCLERLHAIDEIDQILLMLRPGDPWFCEELLLGLDRVSIAEGGGERSESVLLGLEALQVDSDENDWVVVHDAVRPCITGADIRHLMTALADDPVGGLLASPVRETLKRVDSEGRVLETVDRQGLWAAATPQLFRYGLLRQALSAAVSAGQPVTDEASAMEQAGHVPRIIEGRPDNLKVTHPADLELAGQILGSQQKLESEEAKTG